MRKKNQERALGDAEATFDETSSMNTAFSSLNRSATALEKLLSNTEALTIEIKNSSKPSSKLTSSLNRLTLAAVIVVGLSLVLVVIKICVGN